jgi:photosynthetic reaction center H subunit
MRGSELSPTTKPEEAHMGRGAITEQLDVAQLLFILFMLFFVGLIAYLHRESKREGYPLVDSRHEPVGAGLFGMPQPKSYHLADGTTMVAPHERDTPTPTIPASQLHINAAYPIVPFSSTAFLGIGPGAYTQRRDIPDVTWEGKPRLVPMRSVKHFTIAPGDADLRGMTVVGYDGVTAGKVTDIWVDLSETTIRYLEVALSNAAGTEPNVMVPLPMADIDKSTGTISVDALLGAQFVDAPRLKSADTITLLDEERIMGYFGGGYLYATPSRQEPLI